jgi:predicted MFS family arabinose efflux permease
MMFVLNVVASVIFAGALNTRIVDPVVPQIALDLAVAPATAALLSTAFAVPYALMQPVLGAMADTFGKGRMMVACLIVMTTAAAAGSIATDFTVLLVSRAVSGMAAGGLFPIGLAIAGDLIPIRDRQVAIGRLLAAGMLGNILGATGSGALTDLAGWRSVFLTTALIGTVALLAATLGLRGAVKDRRERFRFASQIRNFRAIFGNPLAKVCFGAVFLEGTFLFGLFPHMAALLHAGGETRASIAGVVIAGFGAGGLIYTFVVFLLVRHVRERHLMVMGGAFMGLGLALIAVRAPWQFEFAVFVLFGFAFYLLHGPIQVYVTELAPAARSTAASLHAAFFFLGQAAGPVAYKYGLNYIGTTGSLLMSASVLILTGAWCAVTLRHKQQV